MATETAQWNDVYSTDELVAALHLHAAKLARAGSTGPATDLIHAADCISDLAERCALAAETAERLNSMVEETQRRARAALESFSGL
jgi:hypothetical protein